ncbi:MAG: tRNA lysidine(34) synthetase TilS [Bacteroides sp.]|nr:tRNA lysidine(34) synthetase TilS [Bacteroides sp.]
MNVKKVATYIEQQQLLKPGEHVLVALSGGADSVALLRLLRQMGYPCQAAHCNFHLRGEESDRDELFVKKLCEEQQVPLHTIHFDTRSIAQQRKVSIEMAARDLRYTWFEEIRQSCNISAVAVAHHQDDSVETMLLNLLRGTGINGLRGIRPRNGHVIRPLLCLTRNEIIHYLKDIGQSYVTDSTNLQDDYTRNKIRLNLLPLMQEINPAIKESLQRTATHMDEAALIYNTAIEEAKQRVSTSDGIDIKRLLQEPAPKTLLYELLAPLGFNAAQIGSIFQTLNGQAGKEFHSPQWRIIKDRKELIITRHKQSSPPELKMQEYCYTPDFIIPRQKSIACLDLDKISLPLEIRLYKAGDTFIPFGMKGRKLISDYLTNRKFSLLQKEQQWVLCHGEEIYWLIGERIDNRFRVDNQTRRMLVITTVEK